MPADGNPSGRKIQPQSPRLLDCSYCDTLNPQSADILFSVKKGKILLFKKSIGLLK